MRKRLVAGIAILGIGVLLLLKSMGILSFSIWGGFGTYWPIGLILMGVAHLFRQRGLSFLIFLLMVVMGIAYLSEGNFTHQGQVREIVQQAHFENISTLTVNLDFGKGVANLEGGEGEYLVRNTIHTSDAQDPTFRYEDGAVSISRRSQGLDFFRNADEKWDLQLSSAPLLDIEMDYGAAEMNIDLTDLKVKSLDIDSGASTTDIIFGAYPTTADINTGASTVNLRFPEEMGVIMEINGGALSKHIDGFTIDGNTYRSRNYGSAKDTIHVRIDAGATTISAGFIAQSPR